MNILKNKKCNIKINDEEIETLTRWQGPTIKDLQQELERYKNIIDELEIYLKEEYNYYDRQINAGYGYAMGEINRIKNKLKELKGE